MVNSGLQQVQFSASRDGLRAALRAEFAVDVVDVGPDRAHSEKQLAQQSGLAEPGPAGDGNEMAG